MWDVINADVVDGIRSIADRSVQCVVTSPPYYSLRTYSGVEPRTWGDGLQCVFGEEASLEEYIAHSVEVFRELKRVLHPSGTFWLNIGDCYAGGGKHVEPMKYAAVDSQKPERTRQKRLTSKDLLMVPARMAIALQSDGWILRQDNIWAKGVSFCKAFSGSVMPESTRDRTTWAHEHVYQFALHDDYFYDQDGCREAFAASTTKEAVGRGYMGQARKNYAAAKAQNPSDAKRRILAAVAEGAGRNLRNVWVIGKQNFSGAHFACVDSKTEALTRDGWKRHDQLADGHDIVAWVPNEGLTWSSATFHEYDYNGPMVSIQKRDTSQLLTPNHRCVTSRGIVAAEELGYHDETLHASLWRNENSISVGKAMAALLGWFLAEGNWHAKTRHAYISQSIAVNEDNCAKIEDLLDAVNAEWSVRETSKIWRGRSANMHTYTIRGRITNEIETIVGRPKRLSQGLLDNMSWWELQAFLNAFVDGDGHRRSDGRCCIIQKDKQTIDILQFAAIKCGKRAIVSQRKDGVYALYITDGAWLTLRGTNGSHKGINKNAPYKGKVWCPSVASGFWLARRNGKPFITGNTFPEALVRPIVQLATSEKGCCPVCAAPIRRRTIREPVPDDIQAAFNAARQASVATSGRTDGHTRRKPNYRRKVLRTEWEKSCECNFDITRDAQPCRVLDPFNGSGRTGIVAVKLGRDYVGIDASAEYCGIARDAIRAVASRTGTVSVG